MQGSQSSGRQIASAAAAYRAFFAVIIALVLLVIVVPILLLVLPHSADEVPIAAVATCVFLPSAMFGIVCLGRRARHLELDEIENGYTTLDKPGLGLEIRRKGPASKPEPGSRRLDHRVPESTEIQGSVSVAARGASQQPTVSVSFDTRSRVLVGVAVVSGLAALSAAVPLFSASLSVPGSLFVILTGFDIALAILVPGILGTAVAARRVSATAHALGGALGAVVCVPTDFDDDLLAALFALASDNSKPDFISLARKIYLVLTDDSLQIWAHCWRGAQYRRVLLVPAARVLSANADTISRPPQAKLTVRDNFGQPQDLTLAFGAAGALHQQRTVDSVLRHLARLYRTGR